MAEEDVISKIIKKEIRNRQQKINDVSSNITYSKSSDEDEEYNALLKKMLKRNKKKLANKTIAEVDTVLSKGVQKAKLEKENSKNNLSTANMKKTLRKNIMKIIVGRSFSDSNLNLKKPKQKAHNRHKSMKTTINPSNLLNDEEYTSLLNTSVKKMKNSKRKGSKVVIGNDAVLPKEVKTPKRKKVNLKNDTSSVYMEKMVNEPILKSIVCRNSSEMKEHKTKTYNKNKNIDLTAMNTSIISNDEEYTSLLNTFVKKIKKNKQKSTKTVIKADTVLPKRVKKTKQQKDNFKKDTSSVFINDLHHDKNMECVISDSNSAEKKEKRKKYSLSKNVDFTTMNTSNISDDEDYKSLLNTFVKKIQKKGTKTVIKKDTVLPKEVNKTKQQKVNLKKDTSSVHTNKTHRGHISKSLVGTNSSDSNSEVKKEKRMTHSIKKNLTTMNISSMSDDEDYTLLLNTFAKKMKKNEKKATKFQAETQVKSLPSNEVTKRALLTTPVAIFKCTICNNSFVSLRALNYHKTRIHHKNIFMCQICGKGYSLKWELRLHYKTHPGDWPFECNVCGDRFMQDFDLRLHYKFHIDEWPFGCEVCGKRFKKRAGCVEHCKIHINTKDHKCDVCGKEFFCKGVFRRHYKTHTGERPNVCDICGKTFVQSIQLINHYRTHTGKRPFDCDICGKAFAVRYSLIIHHRTHTGEKPYECGLCSMSFTNSSNLKQHSKRKHHKRL